MFIFKNTASQNVELWPLKHIIEIRALSFPNGEPTIGDVNAVEVSIKIWVFFSNLRISVS